MASPPSTDDIVDMQALDALRTSLGESADTVIREFFDLVKVSIDKAIEAFDNKDYETFGGYCHQIKSNVGFLGGKELEQLCIDIELLCLQKNASGVDALGEPFKRCCEKTMDCLEEAI